MTCPMSAHGLLTGRNHVVSLRAGMGVRTVRKSGSLCVVMHSDSGFLHPATQEGRSKMIKFYNMPQFAFIELGSTPQVFKR